MLLGIFAKTFVRPTLQETLDAVQSHGLHCVQFNMTCAGLPTLPDHIGPGLCRLIYQELLARNISMAAVSGTFNMIHPDERQRADGMRRLRVLAEARAALGTRIITVCTGTRDPANMWRRHPDNDTKEAWHDLQVSMSEALTIAEETGVTLAIEPEVANVVDTAQKAYRLLRRLKSQHLAIVMDPANLFHRGEIFRQREIMDEAFELLGKDIVIAHAKDLSHDGEAGKEAAGTGLLDYDHYLGCLQRAGFDGPLILHSLAEEQVGECLTFLRKKTLGFPPHRVK
jgi:sugar phosphate isomerase/epimerase